MYFEKLLPTERRSLLPELKPLETSVLTKVKNDLSTAGFQSGNPEIFIDAAVTLTDNVNLNFEVHTRRWFTYDLNDYNYCVVRDQHIYPDGGQRKLVFEYNPRAQSGEDDEMERILMPKTTVNYRYAFRSDHRNVPDKEVSLPDNEREKFLEDILKANPSIIDTAAKLLFDRGDNPHWINPQLSSYVFDPKEYKKLRGITIYPPIRQTSKS